MPSIKQFDSECDADCLGVAFGSKLFAYASSLRSDDKRVKHSGIVIRVLTSTSIAGWQLLFTKDKWLQVRSATVFTTRHSYNISYQLWIHGKLAAQRELYRIKPTLAIYILTYILCLTALFCRFYILCFLYRFPSMLILCLCFVLFGWMSAACVVFSIYTLSFNCVLIFSYALLPNIGKYFIFEKAFNNSAPD